VVDIQNLVITNQYKSLPGKSSMQLFH